MVTSDKSYPNINFVDTNAETLVNNLIKSYEMFTGRTLYPADPTRLLILWIANVLIQERAIINEAAKQNVPRYAQGKNLDSLGEIFKDVYRLKAKSAKATFRFYLSTKLPDKQLIPQGTRVTVDGKITFQTIENLFIEQGNLYGDVLAECQMNGKIGNGFIPGQITQLIDIYPYYERVENITESSGGAEEENDEDFYNRMRESVETFSTAGPAGAYIYHTKSVSPLISDVSAISSKQGVADICVLLKDGELPKQEMLKEIQEKLSADKIRPLTDYVQVKAPQIVKFDIEIKYFISKFSQNSIATIQSSIEDAVSEYIKWQTEKMGRDINPSYLISLLMKTKIKRVEVVKPQYECIPENMVARLNQLSILNGGLEDE